MPTILLHRHTLPLTAFVPLLRSNHVVPAAVAFAALISEILVVTLAGLPYRPGQLRSEYVFCGVASAVLLAIMLGIAVWAATWRALAVPHLPRRPDSVAAVMTYVAGTRMVADFEGIERVGVRERDRVIVGLRKRYVYGHVERKSGFGSGRWVVDDVAGDVGRPGSKETDRTRSTV